MVLYTWVCALGAGRFWWSRPMHGKQVWLAPLFEGMFWMGTRQHFTLHHAAAHAWYTCLSPVPMSAGEVFFDLLGTGRCQDANGKYVYHAGV